MNQHPNQTKMKMIKIIDRKLNIVELPCGKWCNSLDLDKLDCINTVGNIIVKYNLQQKLINENVRNNF